jgi:hypothetical protein
MKINELYKFYGVLGLFLFGHKLLAQSQDAEDIFSITHAYKSGQWIHLDAEGCVMSSFNSNYSYNNAGHINLQRDLKLPIVMDNKTDRLFNSEHILWQDKKKYMDVYLLPKNDNKTLLIRVLNEGCTDKNLKYFLINGLINNSIPTEPYPQNDNDNSIKILGKTFILGTNFKFYSPSNIESSDSSVMLTYTAFRSVRRAKAYINKSKKDMIKQSQGVMFSTRKIKLFFDDNKTTNGLKVLGHQLTRPHAPVSRVTYFFYREIEGKHLACRINHFTHIKAKMPNYLNQFIMFK